jgi:hypothetical protein
LRSYWEEKAAAPIQKAEITAVAAGITIKKVCNPEICYFSR